MCKCHGRDDSKWSKLIMFFPHLEDDKMGIPICFNGQLPKGCLLCGLQMHQHQLIFSQSIYIGGSLQSMFWPCGHPGVQKKIGDFAHWFPMCLDGAPMSQTEKMICCCALRHAASVAYGSKMFAWERSYTPKLYIGYLYVSLISIWGLILKSKLSIPTQVWALDRKQAHWLPSCSKRVALDLILGYKHCYPHLHPQYILIRGGPNQFQKIFSPKVSDPSWGFL